MVLITSVGCGNFQCIFKPCKGYQPKNLFSAPHLKFSRRQWLLLFTVIYICQLQKLREYG